MLFAVKNERTLKSAESRREKILMACIRLIAEGGPDAITHRKVAARAEVPLGAMTYYFASREELVREAFRYYLSEASAFMARVGQEVRPTSAAAIVELALEIVPRELIDPIIGRAEYEMILYAARDPIVAREFVAWERGVEAGLAAPLELLGATRPMDAARTIIDLVRGFELERLTHPAVEIEDLRRRLAPVVLALTSARNDSNRPSARARTRNRGRSVLPRRNPIQKKK